MVIFGREKDEKKEEKSLPVTQQPEVYTDTGTGMAWIALPTRKMTGFSVILAMDSFKLGIVSFCEQQRKRAQIITPVIGTIPDLKKS